MSVIDSKTKSILLSAYNNIDKQSLPNKGDGWVNLVKFAPAIKKSGVDYHEFGYEKVGEFLNDIPDFDIYTDRSTFPPVKYIRLKNIIKKLPDIDEAKELVNDWKIGDNPVIGQYYYNSDDKYYGFKNIATLTFNDLTYLDGKEVEIILDAPIESLKINEFYEFQWIIIKSNNERGYSLEIMPNTPFRTIDPKQLVDRLYKVWANCDPTISNQMKNTMKMVSTQLTASSDGTFIYELLQNANDYPIEDESGNSVPVNVEFHITGDYLIYRHSGDFFTPRNIAAISKLAAGEKKAKKNAIGYKGIGFKTIFNGNDYAYLRSGEYSLRFDESARVSRDDPWQIMPIWTDSIDIDKRVNQLFDKGAERFRVQMAIRPKDQNQLRGGSNNTYEYLFLDIFKDEKDILFVPNLHSVQVFVDGLPRKKCTKNSSNWVLTREPYVYLFNQEEIDEINNEVLASAGKIPDKYLNFKDTRVMFACRRNGNRLLPVENATVNCYLPTLAKFGFPFMFNTDMIPTGPRDNIELKIKLNERFARIAGSKCFLWIRDLLTSKKYHLGSVFSLVPDFKKCKKEHSDYLSLIEKFEEAFNESLQTGTIIPISQGIAPVCRVILDTTGLSTSGIMTDDQFHKFTGMGDYYLPLPILRNDKHFNAFLKRYAKDEQKFDVENFTELIANEDFQEWLKDQDNNNKFLNFLLERDYLEDLLEEDIFIEADGDLFSASLLHYDVDKYLVDLQAFTNHLYYLSLATREFFKDNEKWDSVVDGKFKKFNCSSFVNEKLLSVVNIETTKASLKDKDNSLHFFKFLAENVGYAEKYKELPFFDVNGNVVDNFLDKFIFLHNEEGETVCKSEWLKNIQISFINDSYPGIVQSYFRNFDVQDYSDEFIIKNIILSDDYKTSVSETINDNLTTSINFINFCFRNKCQIPVLGLNSYTLNVYDCEGESEWYLNENDVYFPSSTFDYYSQKAWIDSSWLTCLNSSYIPDGFLESEYKKFFTDTFGIEELTDETFYEYIVRKNRTNLFSKIKGSEDKDGHKNFDFVKYLDANYKLIFEDQNDAKLFTELVIASDEGNDVSLSKVNLYTYNTELAQIIKLPWFPKNVVTLTHHEYGVSKALEKLGVTRFSFADFYDKIIVGNLTAINSSILNISDSVVFHNFIIEHKKSLLDDQVSKMKDAKVFLNGVSTPVLKATGHKILSSKANELFKLGLVQGSSLDLIASEYEPEANIEYWENRLGNSIFTLSHFASWLNENRTEFTTTLQNTSLNISFWRWLKENATDALLKEAKGLPVLLASSDENFAPSDSVFFSDEYLVDAKIESIVRRFNEDANFISPLYVDDFNKISEWKEFFAKAGAKFEIVDILIDTIDNSLSKVEDSNLIKLITDNREALEAHYEDTLVKHLHDLRIKAKDNQFYNIGNVILVNYDLAEPFEYIIIPNQVSFSYPKENRLIDDLMQDIEGKRIQSYNEWQQLKLDYYLSLQDNDAEKIRPIHFLFVNELSKIRNSSTDSLSHLLHVDKIKVLNRNNVFCEASTLTIGTIYNPFFDFEKCGVTDLQYVSDEYDKKCYEYVGRFFRTINMHRDFLESDLPYLAQRACSIYFWTTYIEKQTESDTKSKISAIQKLILEHKFDEVACIPTKDTMKLPSDLYYGTEVDKYITKLEDWENKTPLIDLPEVRIGESGLTLFAMLPFKKSLDFLDALYALFNVHSEKSRPQLVKWIIDGYDESFLPKINEYRDDKLAVWKNSQGDKIQIKELYALEYGKKNLEQYFGTNPKILNKEYLPSGDAFRKACDILGITTITEQDFIMDPIDDTLCKRYDSDFQLFALIIAGILDSENWNVIYSSYCEKLKSLQLHRCDSILIKYKYDSSINQNFKQFYRKEKDSNFYFVEDIYGLLVFQDFVNELIEYLGIKGIQNDMVKHIMLSRENALKIVQNYHHLISDEDFKTELVKLAPQIKSKLIKKIEHQEDDDIEIARPVFTASSKSEQEDKARAENQTEHQEDSSTKEAYIPNEYNYDSENEEATNYTEDENTNDNGQPSNSAPTKTSNDYPNNSIEKRYNTDQGTSHTKDREDSGSVYSEDSSKETPADYVYDHDGDDHIGSVDNDPDYDKLGEKPSKPHSYSSRRYHPKPYTKSEVNRLRSNPSPLALESLPPTEQELEILGKMNITPEQIADTNYLAQLRLYQNLIERGDIPEESKEEFVHNAADVTTHKLVNGKYIHTCSAARGVMYISPSVWDKMLDDRWEICVYLDGRGSKFAYIKNREQFLQLVEKDDVVIKITGKEKVDVVNSLYSIILNGVKGTAYTLIRVSSTTNMDAVFAHYVGAMAEAEDGNDDYNNNDY